MEMMRTFHGLSKQRTVAILVLVTDIARMLTA